MPRWNARPQNARPKADPAETLFWTGGPRKNGVALKKAAAKPSGRPRTTEEEVEAEDYRDGNPFAAYCIIVSSVLGDQPMTIGAINRALGERSRPHWTMDALARVAVLHEGYIDKFTRIKEKKYEAAACGDPAQSDSGPLQLPEDL